MFDCGQAAAGCGVWELRQGGAQRPLLRYCLSIWRIRTDRATDKNTLPIFSADPHPQLGALAFTAHQRYRPFFWQQQSSAGARQRQRRTCRVPRAAGEAGEAHANNCLFLLNFSNQVRLRGPLSRWRSVLHLMLSLRVCRWSE